MTRLTFILSLLCLGCLWRPDSGIAERGISPPPLPDGLPLVHVQPPPAVPPVILNLNPSNFVLLNGITSTLPPACQSTTVRPERDGQWMPAPMRFWQRPFDYLDANGDRMVARVEIHFTALAGHRYRLVSCPQPLWMGHEELYVDWSGEEWDALTQWVAPIYAANPIPMHYWLEVE